MAERICTMKPNEGGAPVLPGRDRAVRSIRATGGRPRQCDTRADRQSQIESMSPERGGEEVAAWWRELPRISTAGGGDNSAADCGRGSHDRGHAVGVSSGGSPTARHRASWRRRSPTRNPASRARRRRAQCPDDQEPAQPTGKYVGCRAEEGEELARTVQRLLQASADRAGAGQPGQPEKVDPPDNVQRLADVVRLNQMSATRYRAWCRRTA